MGRQCVVPQLLAGVLPMAGQGALTAMLHGLCADTSEGPAWALEHAQVLAFHTLSRLQQLHLNVELSSRGVFSRADSTSAFKPGIGGLGAHMPSPLVDAL